MLRSFILILVLVCALFAATNSIAEDTPAAYTPPLIEESLPRMLSRVNKQRGSRSYRRRSRVARSQPRKRFYRRAVIRRSGRRWGAQFSALGKQQNTNGSFLGLLPAFGVRGFMDFPIVGNFILEPNVGLLVSAQGVAQLRTTQLRLTPGVDVLWSPNPVARLRWQVGVTNKLDVIWSRIQAFEDSTSGLGLGYRVGPTAGIAVKTGADSAFTVDFDWTMDVFNQGRSHFGLSVGLAFWL